MNMIGHDHVATNCNSTGETCFAKGDEPFIRKQTPSAMRIECDEVQRWVVPFERDAVALAVDWARDRL
jgi:hypothetical protein